MDLLNEYYREYTIMNQTTTGDPEGGYISVWTAGATVKMALNDPTQTQRVIAASKNVEVVQGAIFPRGTPVKAGTYLRGVDDESSVYLVQTNPVEAPKSAGLQVIKAEVIKTRLPA